MHEPWARLGDVSPLDLVDARLQAHHAAQWLAKSARSGLVAEPDDSHSSLGWDNDAGALITHPIGVADEEIKVGLHIADFVLFVAPVGEEPSALLLSESDPGEVAHWIDAVLSRLGHQPATRITLPYDMPARTGDGASGPERAALARWFAAGADILEETAASLADITPGPTTVRCWPHHFDIATLVRLEAGDAEDAKSIGIGLSPGDESYAQPYFYVAPWPYPDASALPALSPGRWHRDGFTAAILTAEEIVATADPRATTAGFIATATAACRDALGA